MFFWRNDKWIVKTVKIKIGIINMLKKFLIVGLNEKKKCAYLVQQKKRR